MFSDTEQPLKMNTITYYSVTNSIGVLGPDLIITHY